MLLIKAFSKKDFDDGTFCATTSVDRRVRMILYPGLVKYGRLVATGDQYILTGDYDFNFLDSIHFLNP